MKVHEKGFNVYFCILIGKVACEKFPINVITHVLKKRPTCREIVQNSVSYQTISFITVSKLCSSFEMQRNDMKGGETSVF